MAAFKTTPLYGGALVCDLPANFADVSTLRQVPDNQEVYIDKDGFTSIIYDITERVGGPGSGAEIDGRALTTHLEELVGDDIETVKVWNTTPTLFSRLGEDIPAYTLIATQAPKTSEKSSASPARPDFTAIILTLVRLEKEMTDILITINVPHIKGEYDEEDVDLELGKQGKLSGVVSVSRLEESKGKEKETELTDEDPFADAVAENASATDATSAPRWVPVPAARRLVSGKYHAI